jgi:hypothetical protein
MALSPRQVVGRVCIAVGTVAAPVGAFVFDFNESHVRNPAWPPHAKFHNAQTMSLAVALAGLTLWQLRPSVRRVGLASALGSTYWLTQVSSLAFPGTALKDPGVQYRAVKGDQRVPIIACLGLIAVGTRLSR